MKDTSPVLSLGWVKAVFIQRELYVGLAKAENPEDDVIFCWTWKPNWSIMDISTAQQF